MEIRIRHELPGRLRLAYNRRALSTQQAVLAQSLIAVQKGVIDISLNSLAGSFLIVYDSESISRSDILRLFLAMTDKYLQDQSLLDSVADMPQTESGILSILLDTAVKYLLKKLLPLPVQKLILYSKIIPRICKALSTASQGKVFSTEMLDAAALTAAGMSGNIQAANSISTLLSMGEQIEDITRRRSYDDLARTLLINDEPVHLIENDEERSIPASALQKGDLIIVRKGSLIPVDGIVEQGEGEVNQAGITGEPLPVEKRAGLPVFAGTVLEEGELTIRVTAAGRETRVHNIIEMIERSQSLKSRAELRCERIAERIVPFNFILAALTYALTGSSLKAMSTLMVDYSCAMKLAAPIAVLAAMREAAAMGISVKGGVYLEEAALADTVIFDKTGTLTYANPTLIDIFPFEGFSREDVLSIAACLEEHFPHPLARAVVQAAEDAGISHPEKHARVEYIVSRGIASSLDDKKLFIGSAHFIFDDSGIPCPPEAKKIQKKCLDSGYSLLYLGIDGSLAAILAIGDPVRPEAQDAVLQLKENGVERCLMITGDTDGAAQKIAEQTGLDSWYAQALPEDKVGFVEKEQAEGRRVLMVGDGINDAPALSAADVGVAMDGCSSVAGDTADIVLAEGGLKNLIRVRQLGQELLSKVDRNNAVIIGGNSALLICGMFGLISPSAAALMHNSLTVGISLSAMRSLLPEECSRV